MAETKTDETDQAETEGGKDRVGRVIDIAGIIAGAIVGIILFDVLSGGKISRLLVRAKGPCEDCQDKTEQAQEETSRDG